MSITDKQIEIVSLAMMNANRFMPGYIVDEADPLGVNKSIKAGLEAYEDSKWIKFDADDESTWPNLSRSSLGPSEESDYLFSQLGGDLVFMVKKNDGSIVWVDSNDQIENRCITHYQYPPKFKG